MKSLPKKTKSANHSHRDKPAIRIAFVMDAPAHLNATVDSTIELIRAHVRHGAEAWIVLRKDLYLCGGELRIRARRMQVHDDDDNWLTLDERGDEAVTAFDLIWLRLEPPVDSGFRIVCQLLAHARVAGVPVVNDPTAIETREEKLAALRFPALCPATMVSSDRATLLAFAATQVNGCMLKPLDSMGGRGVFAFTTCDSNLAVAIDAALTDGKTLVLQERLPDIAAGDRRVFIIDGVPFEHMLNRVPAAGSHLGNMAAGGIATAMPLGVDERHIGTTLGPSLRKAGILFAGIDVIGGKLTEINITCPTGLRSVRTQTDVDPASTIVAAATRLTN